MSAATCPCHNTAILARHERSVLRYSRPPQPPTARRKSQPRTLSNAADRGTLVRQPRIRPLHAGDSLHVSYCSSRCNNSDSTNSSTEAMSQTTHVVNTHNLIVRNGRKTKPIVTLKITAEVGLFPAPCLLPTPSATYLLPSKRQPTPPSPFDFNLQPPLRIHPITSIHPAQHYTMRSFPFTFHVAES